ncbi:MAG: ATP-binding protein [Thermodesulfovibrionales bacterium]
MNRKSIQMSVLLGTVAVIVVTGFMMILLVKFMLPGKLLGILEEKTIAQARLVASEIANPLLTEQFFDLRIRLNDLKRSDDSIAYAFVIDAHDKVVAHTFESGFPSELRTANRVAAGRKQTVKQLTTGIEHYLDVGMPVLSGGIGELHVGTFLAPVEQGVNRIVAMIVWIIIATSAAGGIIAVILTRRELRPLRELGQAIESFGRGDMVQQVLPLDNSNEIGQLIVVFNKMAGDIRTSHEELEHTKNFLVSLINGVNERIMVVRPDYTVLMSNKAMAQGTERDFCYTLSHQRSEPCDEHDQVCPLREILRTKQSLTVTHTHMSANGTQYVEEIAASPFMDERGELLYVIEVCRDITEKQRLHEMQVALDKRIAVQQKEESISTLAGGIAHDFNNILMGILGNAELLGMTLESQENEKMLVNNIIKSSERMADLTKQLLAYAKGGMYQPGKLSLNDAVKKALNMAHIEKYQHIETRLLLEEDLWPVFADREQVKQVMINLFTNAFEAMEYSGGCLTVRTINEPDRPSWECVSFKERHPAGDYVHVIVSDTGPGIPQEKLHRIFEPFFSTKFIGRGLGLAAVAGIIQNHHGCVSVRSGAETGTLFDIYLPKMSVNTA